METTLKEEISKVEYGNEALMAIEKGYHKYNDILSQSHIRNNVQLDRTLKKLIDLGIVEKCAPINDERNKKKITYQLKDNAMAFYYRYVFNNRSYLGMMDPHVYYQTLIEKDFRDSFVPHHFEGICKEFLIRQNQKGKLPFPFLKIGKYHFDDSVHHRNGEFDTVTYDGNKYVSYECKYQDKKISESIIRQERESLSDIPLSDNVEMGFFSKCGYEKKHAKEEGFYTLDDLYSFSSEP